MPRRKCTQERAKDSTVRKREKLQKLLDKRSAILEECNHDIDLLKRHNTAYTNRKHSDYKRFSSLYRAYLRTNQQIEKLHNELSQTLYPNFQIDEEPEEEIVPKCANCNRRVIESCESFYEINLRPVLSNNIKQCSRFRFVRSTRGNTEPIEYQLCEQCEQHLTHTDLDVAKQPNNMWPAFIWNILQSSQIHDTYECEFIWKFIPLQWRRWWIDEVHSQFPSFYRSVTLSQSTSIFVDRTKKSRFGCLDKE